MEVQTLYGRMHELYPKVINNGVLYAQLYAQVELYAQELDTHAPVIVQHITDTHIDDFDTFALFVSTLWDTFVISQKQLLRRYGDDSNDFVCSRINDIDTHTRLKQLFTGSARSTIAQMTSGGTVRFVSFLIEEVNATTLRVSQTVTHPNNSFAVFTGPVDSEVLTCLAKRSAREYRIIGMHGRLSVHYDIYYERPSTLGGVFHRDSAPNDEPTQFVSLEYFANDVIINGVQFPCVLIGPELIEHTGDIENSSFDTGAHTIGDPSVRVLLIDGNTMLFNNKYIHATPAIRGETDPYNFTDQRRIDINPRMMGSPVTAMLMRAQPRNFIRGWYSNVTGEVLGNFSLLIPTEVEIMYDVESADIVGGGKVPLKLTEFRLSGLTNIKIVFSDKEQIITHASTIKKMISTEISQLISLVIKTKVAPQIKYLPHNTQQKNKIRHSKTRTTKHSKTRPNHNKTRPNHSKTRPKHSKTRPKHSKIYLK